jgi:hypothetical protein
LIAAAYRHAEGEGEMPRELELLRYIDRFGLGVLGRAPGAGELRRMAMAERTVKAYQALHQSENWAAWAEKNTGDAKLLEIGASYGE